MEATFAIEEGYSPRSTYGLGTHDLVLDLGSGEPLAALTIRATRRVAVFQIRFEPGVREVLKVMVKAVPREDGTSLTRATYLGSVVVRPSVPDVLEVKFTLAIADDVLFAHVSSGSDFEAELTRPVNEPMQKLDALIGLTAAKEQVRAHLSFIDVQERRRQANLPRVEVSRHLIFVGSPGTGKTTVARLIGEVYYARGICKSQAFVEVDRSALVAGYVGQTALKTTEKLEAARGGILFIDEAYTLASGDAAQAHDFGREAIDTILKFMEDHRDDIIIIAAGYKDEMERFITANPGLESRFKTVIRFENYTAEEMLQMFEALCEASSYQIATEGDVRSLVLTHFEKLCRAARRGFANGREVRNFFENCVQSQAARVHALPGATVEQLRSIEYLDIVDLVFPPNPSLQRS